MAESLSTTQFCNVMENDDMTKRTENEIIHFLDLDDIEEKDQIIKDLLESGRQSLTKHQECLKPDLYLAVSVGNDNQLMKSLKNYFEQLWKSEYKLHEWFISFLQQHENDEHYQCILNRTAQYGNKYMKDCPILSIVLQLLFEGIDDQCLNESNIFNDLWSSITNDGLDSAEKYSDNISRKLLDEMIQNRRSVLFKAVREFHRQKLFKLLSETNIKDKDHLYDFILDNVAENGWLNGLEASKDRIVPKYFKMLLEKIPSQKQPVEQEKVTQLIQTPTPVPIQTSIPAPVQTPIPVPIETPISVPIQTQPVGNVTYDEREKRQLNVEDLRQDLARMPSCAEKSITELLVHFENKLLDNCMYSQDNNKEISLLQKLQTELETGEFFSEKIERNMRDLERYVRSSDILQTIRSLGELMLKIRPLHVQEIQRLVEKAKNAGRLIDQKEIILLIGQTGTGKSTTIQFLAGSRMKETKIEIEPGKFLDHITVDGPVANSELRNVTTSARNKSETRYIAPVTIQLREVFGPHEYGEIILCDAPGFDDTAGPEVDIANGVGVIEAIKKCRSVKILALSSYKSLGDRGQGIQKLAHLLINMVYGIENRLNAIFYAFTKYPSNVDISALLTDIKISKVDTDPLLLSDNAFVKVLTDMIEKTQSGAEKIDPIRGDRKSIIKKLKGTQGIMHPEESFQFLFGEATQARITNQSQIDKSNINCALKRKDINLIMYYLDRLRILKDLIKHSAAEDDYKDAVRVITETIMKYCDGVKESFNRSLTSLDGLRQEHIIEYKNAIEYIQKAEKLNEYLESTIMSPESLMQNIHSELRKVFDSLAKEDLYDPLVRIYLNNVCILKETFKELEPFYSNTCDNYKKRFETLVESCFQFISNNDFDNTADVIFKISKCLPILDVHLHGFVEEKYKHTIQSLLLHLSSIFEQASSVLAKIRLNENDVKAIRDRVNTLSKAKENLALQDRVSTYIELFVKKNNNSSENIQTINDIYNALLGKIEECFKHINNRIFEIFKSNQDRALEDVETLINDIDQIRTIPEIESKTAGAYYHTVGLISERIHKLQRDVEELLFTIENQSATRNYAHIARLVSRLKNAKWMNRISPEAYDTTINRVTDELIQYSHQLTQSLTRLDLSLRRPENVLIAENIFNNVEALSILERSVPELKKCKDEMVQYFLEGLQESFSRIQKTLNLETNEGYQKKQELKKCEDIKREYDNLHPANILLQKHEFSNVDQLISEIHPLENEDNTQHGNQSERSLYNSSLSSLKSIKEEYDSLTAKSDSTNEQINYLKEKGIENIECLNEKVERLKIELIEEKRRTIEQQNNKQTYNLSHNDTSTVDKALLYASNCERIVNIRVQQMARDIHDILNKYISEYGNFLQNDITRLFNELTSGTSDENSFLKSSQDLETRIGQLFSLREYTYVFDCIEGKKKVEHWRGKFTKQHRDMSTLMESLSISGRTEELKKQVIIAQGLMGSDDYFCDSHSTNRLAALYNNYQIGIAAETSQAYENVRKDISEEDYVKVDMTLATIDIKKLNQKDVSYIEHSLQSCLNRLMQITRMTVNTLDSKIDYTKNNESKIKKINENIGKICTVLTLRNVMKFIDEKTKSNLEGFEESIKQLLTDIFLQDLTYIESFISSDDIFEAEQSTENLSRTQLELTNHFDMKSVTEKVNEVKNRLNDLPKNCLPKNYFKHIENYSKKPPKDLLPKLDKAVLSYPKYAGIRTSILDDIPQFFTEAIESARKAPIGKRSAEMFSLNNALRLSPKDIQDKFKSDIDTLIERFKSEEENYERDLKGFLEKTAVDDSVIRKIGQVAPQYQQQNRHELLQILRTEVITKLTSHWQLAQDAVDKKDVPSTIDNIRQIIKYKEHVDSVEQVDDYYKKVCNLISESINSSIITCKNMLQIEKIETVDQAFSYMIVCIELCEEFPKRKDELLPGKVLQNVKEGLKYLSDCWQNTSKAFDTALTEMKIQLLVEITNVTERSNKFLTKIKSCPCQHTLIVEFVREMKNVKSYSEMISQLKKTIIDLKENFNSELCSDEIKRFEVKRDDLLNKLATSLKALKLFNIEYKDLLISQSEIQQIEKDFEGKIEDIKKKLLETASIDQPRASDSDNFRIYYNHLISLKKYISLPNAKIEETLELAEKKIFEKVMSLSKDIAGARDDTTKVADLIVRMKFFAENFSMFDTKINGIIDEILKTFKTQYRALTVSQLTVILEKSDEGSRVIAEHSCLSGEDWRKRREKMQNQDNIKYVIENLEGDDVADDVLRKRYFDFKEKYEELLSKYLTSFNPKNSTEPDLSILISQTKSLVGVLVQNPNNINWNSYLRDRLPELLAYIFAIWTLKNTQHYNAMRGIETSQAYLLMPHAAQVISIFRILGIGYKKNRTVFGYKVPLIKRISDDLVNNLVQIGTGEGKSVVLAITACVFALIGIDVNCSCYSEYLSVRDKTDFASLFQVLGIEKYIEYGTFNKLCENFLNEQCNIREKVFDIIMNNKKAIDVGRTITRSRQKVLLVDEVDVFLSEKFYGGIYTPSIYIKHSTVKALLDVLWQSRNPSLNNIGKLRSLNAVKQLSQYKDCVAQFSNWIFLFDEAIKDMLTALQSFQSTTYIVHNDKIVYVEGESIVENVVHGYDTIWAYYFENEKGNISSSSLESSVGIIINCGTFSYAEMPHDFAYITGVTGTLKTLAEPEKRILKNVYQIHQNTYMPSVFGKSNRNYNPMNDVQAVNKSEYFQKIRGAIDDMCRAKRAILVFFESEDKLMEFYNSSELSDKKDVVQIITEKVSAKERELCIKRAATDGKVTLLTRTFGRGTDFICRNQQVLANGGVHVLQTFFSEELSEEYQIMGRGARQGENGSYRMILLDSDLEWILGAEWEQELPQITGSVLYKNLDEARNKLYECKCAAKEVGIDQRKREHQSSKQFIKALLEGNMSFVQTFLKERNLGANLDSDVSRTLLLMDATGSMSNLLSAAKETVCTMFERASAILEEKNLPTDIFCMQFAIYRNYNSKENKILEVSSWESKPSQLRAFMHRIGPEGGWGNEAIEIALWHAVEESKMGEGISQVILIGDAPANTKDEVAKKRADFGEKYWKTTRFAISTYYEDELKKLKDKGIPVHAFYLTNLAKDNFKQIAEKTGGRSEYLDISSSNGAELLTNFVTEEVLRKVAGDSAVELYRQKYSKKTFTS